MNEIRKMGGREKGRVKCRSDLSNEDVGLTLFLDALSSAMTHSKPEPGVLYFILESSQWN